MPYKRIKKTIYTKSSGRWKKKQTCKSVASAKKALKLLRGLEHGTIKKLRKTKKGKKRKK